MSLEGLSESYQPQSRQRRFLDHLQSVPLDGQLAAGEVRPQRHGISAHQWACQRALPVMPRQQQLQSANCAHGLRQFRTPPDYVASNHAAGPRISLSPYTTLSRAPARAGFYTTCNLAHSTVSWLQGKFAQTATGLPLANGDASVPCPSCHVNNNYNLQIAPTDCGNSGCHLTTWQQTNNPVHSSAGAPFAAANCSTCHNTVSWTTAIFDHATTGGALTGSHQLAPARKVVACTD